MLYGMAKEMKKKKKITFFYKNYQLKKNYLKVYPKTLSTLLIVAVLLLYKYFWDSSNSVYFDTMQ